MSEAISAYHSVTASSEFRELARLRAKARHDEAQALYNAERKGKAAGETEKAFAIARRLAKMGLPIDKIITATGLSLEEIEGLNNTDQ